MSLLALVRVIAVLSSGLFAGILFGDRMGAAYARPVLTPSSFVQLQQIIHVHFVKLMPPLILTAIAGGPDFVTPPSRRPVFQTTDAGRMPAVHDLERGGPARRHERNLAPLGERPHRPHHSLPGSLRPGSGCPGSLPVTEYECGQPLVSGLSTLSQGENI